MPKSRKRKPKPRRQHDRGDRRQLRSVSSPTAGLAAGLLSAVARSASDPTPLDAELMIATSLGHMWEHGRYGRIEGVCDMVAELCAGIPNDHPASHAMLRILEELAPPQSAEVLAERRRGMPAQDADSGSLDARWVEQINQVELVDAIAMSDPYDDQLNLIMGFEYPQPGGAPSQGQHTVVVLVDHNLHLVKDMFFALGLEPLAMARDIAVQGDTVPVPFDPQHAADTIRHHLEITDITGGEPFGELSARTRFLVEGRLKALPDPRPIEVIDPYETWPEEARNKLVESFIRSRDGVAVLASEAYPDGKAPLRPVARRIARALVDYACDYGAGDPLRWSPIAAELLLLDYAPRKRVWREDDVEWIPDVLDAWVTFAGRRSKLAPKWVEETQETIVHFALEFRSLMAAGPVPGSASDLVQRMLADGVEIGNEQQMQEWIERYNDALPDPPI